MGFLSYRRCPTKNYLGGNIPSFYTKRAGRVYKTPTIGTSPESLEFNDLMTIFPSADAILLSKELVEINLKYEKSQAENGKFLETIMRMNKKICEMEHASSLQKKNHAHEMGRMKREINSMDQFILNLKEEKSSEEKKAKALFRLAGEQFDKQIRVEKKKVINLTFQMSSIIRKFQESEQKFKDLSQLGTDQLTDWTCKNNALTQDIGYLRFKIQTTFINLTHSMPSPTASPDDLLDKLCLILKDRILESTPSIPFVQLHQPFQDPRCQDVIPVGDSGAISITAVEFYNLYSSLKILGQGSFGKVHLMLERSTGLRRVVKMVMDHPNTDRNIWKEGAVYRYLNSCATTTNPFILKSIAEYKVWDQSSLAHWSLLVLENHVEQDLHGEGSLASLYLHKPLAGINELYEIFAQCALSVEGLHSMGIASNDIKPENFIVNWSPTEGPSLKVIDFGEATAIMADNVFMPLIGTTVFMPPEMFKIGKRCGAEADIWSLGAMFYRLAAGSFPFESSDEIKHLRLRYPRDMDPGLKDLLGKMLERDSKKRLTIEEVLEHHWMAPIVKMVQAYFSLD